MEEVEGARPCEFCRTGAHAKCPVSIYEAAGFKGSMWLCPCAPHGHSLTALAEARRLAEEAIKAEKRAEQDAIHA